MADVTLGYESTGFEKVQTELENLNKAGANISTAFKPAQKTLEEVSSSGSNAFRTMASGAKEATSSIWDFVTGLTKVTTVVAAVNGLLGGLGVYAFGRWSEGMLKATENSRVLEATIRSVLGSEEAFERVSRFAKGYAEGSPTTTYHQIMETMKTFSLLPGTQPVLETGNTEWMKRIMDITTGLARMFPQEGIEGAQHMVRGAIAGMWRPFQLQTGMRPEVLAQRAGMGKEEMESSPLNILKALDIYTQAAPKITTLAGLMNKLRGSYDEWLEAIGNTGIYDKVLGYLGKFNQFVEKTFSGAQGKGLASAIGQAMEYMADSISKIFTKGIDWSTIENLPDALAAFRQLGQNTMEAIKEAWDASKDTITSALTEVISFAAEASVKVAWNAGKTIGLEIWKGTQEGMKEHPAETMLGAAAAGAYAGKKWGPWGMLIGGAVAAEVVAAPTQWETLKGWWSDYDAFMGRVQGRIEEIIGLAPKAEATGMQIAEIAAAGPVVGPAIRSTAVWGASEAAAPGVTPQRGPLVNPQQILLGQQSTLVEAWARQAGKIAEATGAESLTTFDRQTALLKERSAMRDKWIAEEITTEAWRPFQEKSYGEEDRLLAVGGFQSDYFKKLQDMVATPGATPEFKTKMYEQMGGISLQRGEIGPARDYMTKSLDALKESFKDQKTRTEEQLAAENKTASMAEKIYFKLSGDKDKKPESEEVKKMTTPKSAGGGLGEAQDDIHYDVEQGMYTNY